MTDSGSVDLATVGAELLIRAADSPNGRATQLVHTASDVGLSQVLLALREGSELADHDNPGEATLQVLSGAVRLSAGDDGWSVRAGQLIPIPRRRHAVFAEQDSVCMLTVVRIRGEHA
jgi:quercetin dioxygenase-like cupin family protein